MNSLKKLNAIKHSKLLNASVIMFGKKPIKFFPNAKLRCATFGTHDATVVIDMQDFEGDIPSLLKIAEEYFLKNIHIGISSRKIEENISKLKKYHILKRIGSDRGGYWKILK